MSNNYILDDDNNPIAVDDIIEWAQWFEANTDRKRVALTQLKNGGRISTVFLGLDHSFSDNCLPVLWETMIFLGGGFGGADMNRYTSFKAAEAGHKAMCKKWRFPWWIHFKRWLIDGYY